MNLVILEPDEVAESGDVILTGRRAAHLTSVLKVTVRQQIRVGLLDGPRGVGTVERVSDGCVELQCRFDACAPRPPRVDLLLALPRPKVMRRLWAQLAALGVGRIILTNAERVERHYFDTHVLEPTSYRPLLIEGLQQAQDTWLPNVSVHRQFKPLVEDDLDSLCPDGARVVGDPGADRQLRQILPVSAADRILLAIGPEGGWNEFELGLLESHRFQRVGMGPRTLRTDTACIALLSVIHAMEQDGSE
jgi:16S rRNA (uracil1498-N3)-methyltransferase